MTEAQYVGRHLPGHSLRDRYVINEVIGYGGMGSIYLAEDNRLSGRLCAIKQVNQETSLPDDLRAQGREQFYREASVLARLDHPNLPKVSDFFSEGISDYLVMDYIPGEDLKILITRASEAGEYLPIADILQWASQIADALEYLHGQDPPIIHRDIKPSNLKLTPSGLIKLVDFGLVKTMVPDELTVTVIQGRGTALYTPLEQYGGDMGHTDPRSDIYSFGATLYHLTTNRPPVEAKQRFLEPGSLRSPKAINPKVPESLRQGILWALELHPANRPQSTAQLRDFFQGTRSVRGKPSFHAASNSPWPLPTAADRALAALAVALLVLAAGLSLR